MMYLRHLAALAIFMDTKIPCEWEGEKARERRRGERGRVQDCVGESEGKDDCPCGQIRTDSLVNESAPYGRERFVFYSERLGYPLVGA